MEFACFASSLGATSFSLFSGCRLLLSPSSVQESSPFTALIILCMFVARLAT